MKSLTARNWLVTLSLCIMSLCFMSLSPSHILAEEPLIEDSNQPLSISAARAEIDEPKGWASYTGDVELIHGSLSIHCDRLEIYRTASGIEKVIARGSPARYTQTINLHEGEGNAEPEKLNAQANTITYRLESRSIELLENALITQGSNRFEGHSIIYRIDDRKIIAKSDQKSQATDSTQQRVKIVLPVKEQ